MRAENEKESCSQRDSAERKGYVRAHRSFNRIWKERDSAEPDILGKILERDNMNRAYKRVKANKGAPGIDGMTMEAALPWLREHKDELIGRIKGGKYTPSPVRRVEIPKPDGGIRKLGYSYRHRPNHPAGNSTEADANLRANVLGWKLRLQTGKERKGCNTAGKGICRGGISLCGESRLEQVL